MEIAHARVKVIEEMEDAGRSGDDGRNHTATVGPNRSAPVLRRMARSALQLARDIVLIFGNPWFWVAPLFAVDYCVMLWGISWAGFNWGPLGALAAFVGINSPIFIKVSLEVWRIIHIPKTEGLEVSEEDQEKAWNEILASRNAGNETD